MFDDAIVSVFVICVIRSTYISPDTYSTSTGLIWHNDGPIWLEMPSSVVAMQNIIQTQCSWEFPGFIVVCDWL